MAKIPRLDGGSPSAATPGGALPGVNSGAAPAFAAMGNMADVGYKIAADAEREEAQRYRAAAEKKQAIGNLIEAGKLAADFEETLLENLEAVSTQFVGDPAKGVDEFVGRARKLADDHLNAAPNSETGLQFASRANSLIDEYTGRARAQSILRQTQNLKIGLEERKNKVAAQAGRMVSAEQLEGFVAKTKAELYPLFREAYGATADAEWQDTGTRIAQSFAMVQGEKSPVSTAAALRNPAGALAGFLKPEQRASLLDRTERALEKRGELRQYELLNTAVGKTSQLVDLLNEGTLDAPNLIAHQTENQNAIKAARIDKSYTPEQRAAQVKFLEKQGEVIEAIDAIYMRGVKFDPVKASVNDAARIQDISRELKRFKSRSEQLNYVVEQMQNLTLARKAGEITPAGYAAAFGLVSAAHTKAITDEASNDGFGPMWLPWNDARDAGSRKMNELIKTRGQNVSPDQINEAWTSYMARFAQASKKGDVTVGQTERMVRNAFSAETSVDVRVKGD